jgi:hypothetical protein
MLTHEPRMIIMFWTCGSISFKHMFVLVRILGAHTDRIPLQYRCAIHMSNEIGHIYLGVVKEIGHFTFSSP